MEETIVECPVHKKPCYSIVGELEQCCGTSIPALVWTCPRECGFRRFEPIHNPIVDYKGYIDFKKENHETP